MFPKRKFSAFGGSVLVEDAAHERALGDQWRDNPPPPPAAEPEPEPAALPSPFAFVTAAAKKGRGK